VRVTVTRPVLSPDSLKRTTVMSLRATVYSLPDNANFAPGGDGLFELSFPVPHKDGRIATMPGGVCVAAPSTTTTPTPEDSGRTDDTDGVAIERGSFREGESLAFRRRAECNGVHVAWRDFTVRCLSEEEVKSIVADVPGNRIVAAEFKRFVRPAADKKGGASKSSGKSRTGGDDDKGAPGFYGMALVDVGPMLYPGATMLRGAYPIVPFDPAAVGSANVSVTAAVPASGGDEDGERGCLATITTTSIIIPASITVATPTITMSPATATIATTAPSIANLAAVFHH
jgi:hypothetical protein